LQLLRISHHDGVGCCIERKAINLTAANFSEENAFESATLFDSLFYLL